MRQRWPEILDAVKGQSRVAWILLSNATVDSVEDGVLTVLFARDGEAKGFSASGYDRALRQRADVGARGDAADQGAVGGRSWAVPQARRAARTAARTS